MKNKEIRRGKGILDAVFNEAEYFFVNGELSKSKIVDIKYTNNPDSTPIGGTTIFHFEDGTQDVHEIDFSKP